LSGDDIGKTVCKYLGI